MVTPASPHVSPVLQQVFGVLDSPEYSGVHRPVIHDTDAPANLDAELAAPTSSLQSNHAQVRGSAHP